MRHWKRGGKSEEKRIGFQHGILGEPRRKNEHSEYTDTQMR